MAGVEAYKLPAPRHNKAHCALPLILTFLESTIVMRRAANAGRPLHYANRLDVAWRNRDVSSSILASCSEGFLFSQ